MLASDSVRGPSAACLPACPPTGSIGGVQCDVWLGNSLPGAGSAGGNSLGGALVGELATQVLSGQEEPMYKTRLPGPLCSSGAGAEAGNSTACTATWAFTLEVRG